MLSMVLKFFCSCGCFACTLLKKAKEQLKHSKFLLKDVVNVNVSMQAAAAEAVILPLMNEPNHIFN